MAASPFETWLAALDERHLASLTHSEVTRALRALSSCYVERRDKLSRGAALEGAGKRAAFALFYAPQHFLLVREITRALGAARGIRRIIDLGCGTGSAGAALALEAGTVRVEGTDRHPWAAAEANWTYRTLGISGRAAVGDLRRETLKVASGDIVVLAYTVNELSEADRNALLPRILKAHDAGAAVLVIEPIGRRANQWWDGWRGAFASAGGRVDDWRFSVPLPQRQRTLAKGAGLDPQALTARSLYLPSR